MPGKPGSLQAIHADGSSNRQHVVEHQPGGIRGDTTYVPLRIHGCLVYLPTWMVDFYGFHVGEYAIHGSYGCKYVIYVYI